MMNREAWLQAAVEELASMFSEHADLPEVHVSVGFPSKNGLSARNRVIGQCWYGESSKDGKCHIFISPVLDDPTEVLAVLVHELVHVITPGEGHKGAFVKVAKSLGLVGKWTATSAGPELAERLKAIAARLGEYAHAKLDATSWAKKQSTRLIKLACEDCGCTIRTTRKWLDEYQTFSCPCGSEMMEG